MQARCLWWHKDIGCDPLWPGVSDGYPGIEVSIPLERRVDLDGVHECGWHKTSTGEQVQAVASPCQCQPWAFGATEVWLDQWVGDGFRPLNA